MTSQETASTGGEPVVPPWSPGPKASTTGLGTRSLTWLMILGLAILAAVAAWQVGESAHNYFRPTLAASENFRDPAALNREMPAVYSRNGALTYGALGGLLGLALGVAGGLAGRSAGRAVLAAVVGLILGTAAGALPSFAIVPWYWSHRNDDPAALNLLGPLLIHIGLWSAAGLVAGLAFGIGSDGLKPARLVEAALAGLVGAMLGALVYEMAGAFLFPHDHTTDPIPGTSGTRLLARLCIAGFVGLGAIRSIPAECRSG